MTLAEAIYAFNRPYENRVRGALIHKVSPEVAAEVAEELARQSFTLTQDLLPNQQATELEAICYFVAVIGQESRFDPQAINMNLSLGDAPLAFLSPAWDTFTFHLERNSVLLLRGDYGIAMFKLKYLVQAADANDCTQGRTPSDVIRHCSFAPNWALRLSASRYRGLLRWAAATFPTEDPRWMATGAYNQGMRGFKEAYHDHSKPAWVAAQRHIARVQAHYAWFMQQLATP